MALRYDQIQQRSIHNAYQKAEQLIDQLLVHHVRTMELDLHRWGQAGCPETPGPDWGIYHTIGEAGNNVCKLSEALRLLRSFHRADPNHDVITIHLELKSRGSFEAVGTLDTHGADELDAVLQRFLGRDKIFTPADLLAANPGAGTLQQAARPRAGGGWPTVDELRGRFILVVHGESELDTYATAANASARMCFLMREPHVVGVRAHIPELRLPAQLEIVQQNPHVVFYGEVLPANAGPVRERFPGVIMRSLQADDPDTFGDAQAAGVNLVLTDQVDPVAAEWAGTHNEHLYPFARAGLRGRLARTDPQVRDLRPRDRWYVFTTHSGDVWDNADSASFARTGWFAPVTDASGRREDVWQAVIGVPSNNTVHDWGKAFLMARVNEDPGAPYFAVGRAADDHGVIVQWRPRQGAATEQVQLGDVTYRAGSHTPAMDAENVAWVRLRIDEPGGGSTTFTAEASFDGVTWYHVARRRLAGDFLLRGLAACSQRSQQHDSPGVSFAFHRVRRNGRMPMEFTASSIGDADVSLVEMIGEPITRPQVFITQTSSSENVVVLSTEERRGESPFCQADQQTFTWVDALVARTVTYSAKTTDYDDPRVAWSVAGQRVNGDRGSVRTTVAGRSVTVAYTVASDGLLIVNTDAADGAYTVAVRAVATEADGSRERESNELFLHGVGRRTGFDSEYQQFLTGCLRRTLDKLRVRPELILADSPVVSVADRRAPLINEAELTRVVADLRTSQPEVARQVLELARSVRDLSR